MQKHECIKVQGVSAKDKKTAAVRVYGVKGGDVACARPGGVGSAL